MGPSHKETQKIIREIPENQQAQLRFGDIYPTSFAPVLTAEGTLAARWGLERFDKKGVLINARAETVTERQTFRKSFLERRCLIPASGFYEWDSAKKNFTLRAKTETCYTFADFIGSRTESRASSFSRKTPPRPFLIITTASP